MLTVPRESPNEQEEGEMKRSHQIGMEEGIDRKFEKLFLRQARRKKLEYLTLL